MAPNWSKSESTVLKDAGISVTTPTPTSTPFRVDGTAYVTVTHTVDEWTGRSNESSTTEQTIPLSDQDITLVVHDKLTGRKWGEYHASVPNDDDIYSWYCVIPSAPEGSYTLTAVLNAKVSVGSTETDSDLNVRSTMETKSVKRTSKYVVTVDNTPPEVHVQQPAISTSPPWEVTVEGTARDLNGVTKVRWNFSDGQSGDADYDSDTAVWRAKFVLAERTTFYSLLVTAEDTAGNEGSSELQIEGDVEPPEIRYLDLNDKPVFGNVAEVRWEEGTVVPVTIRGETRDLLTDVQEVEWRVADFNPDYKPVTPSGDGLSHWSFSFDVDSRHNRDVWIKATDMAGNSDEKRLELIVSEPPSS